MANGPSADAEADYRRAIGMEPKKASQHRDFGWYLYSTRRFPEALAEYTAAIAIDPKDEKSWRQRGLVWQALGDPAAAGNDYDEAIRLKPNYSWALLSRGMLSLSRGQLDAARDDLEAALKIDRANAEFLVAHGFVALARGELAAAARDDVVLGYRAPNMPDRDILHARILAAGGAARLEEAELDQVIVDGRTDQTDLLVGRAALRQQRGELDGALADLTRAEAAGTGTPGRGAAAIRWQRETLLEQMGRFAEARGELDALRAQYPDDPHIRWRRALADWRLSDYESMLADGWAGL
jgi:tetratricopeptide (TPR) repeat protein